MKVLEKLGGTGVVSSGAHTYSVKYDLRICQEEIRTSSRANPGASTPGLRDIRGRITPVGSPVGTPLMLTLADGRKLKFLFSDSGGNIVLHEWIG